MLSVQSHARLSLNYSVSVEVLIRLVGAKITFCLRAVYKYDLVLIKLLDFRHTAVAETQQ